MKKIETHLPELRSALEIAAQKAVDIANDKEQTDEAFKAAKKLATEALRKYNLKAAEEAFNDWNADGKPVLKALETLYVPDALTLKITMDKERQKMKFVVDENKTLKVDLCHLMETLGPEVFADPHWHGAAQRMCFVFAGNLNKELCGNADFAHFLEKAGKEFEFADDANFTSNNSALKALQKVVDMIIYEGEESEKGDLVNKYKLEKKHWVYVRECLTRQGKNPGEVVMGNTAKVVELVCDLLYCLINNKPLKLVE